MWRQWRSYAIVHAPALHLDRAQGGYTYTGEPPPCWPAYPTAPWLQPACAPLGSMGVSSLKPLNHYLRWLFLEERQLGGTCHDNARRCSSCRVFTTNERHTDWPHRGTHV